MRRSTPQPPPGPSGLENLESGSDCSDEPPLVEESSDEEGGAESAYGGPSDDEEQTSDSEEPTQAHRDRSDAPRFESASA